MNLQLAKNAAVCKVLHGREKIFSFLDRKGWGPVSAVLYQLTSEGGRETEFSNSPDELKVIEGS